MEARLEESSETFLKGAFPSGSVNLLLTPSGPEREAFLVPLLLHGMQSEEPLLAVLSNTSPKKVLTKLALAGGKAKAALRAGQFRLLDWYSHKEGGVQKVTDGGGILLCPGKLETFEKSLHKLLKGGNGRGLAVLEFLTDATWFGKDKALELADSIRDRPLNAYGRAVLVLDADLVAPEVVERLERLADGVVRLHRERSEVGPTWKVSAVTTGQKAEDHYLSMKPPFVGFSITANPEAALVSRALPTQETGPEAASCPKCGASMEDEACIACGYGTDERRLGQVREVLARCEARLRKDVRDVDALFTKSVAQARLRAYDEAIDTLNQLARLDPRYPALWMLKAKIYERVGDNLKAKLCRQRALELEETEMGSALAVRMGKQGFQCPLCQRWLSMEATACPCGAEFDEDAAT
ncbi:MAG: tetratricopeptide repeat protein [Thermoplasmata archaeon]